MGWRELDIAARRMVRRPFFAVSAVLLIGSSLGIAVTVGTVAHEALLSALPYPDEDRLAFLYWSRPDPPIPDMSLSLRVTRELPSRTDAFEVVGATLTPVSVTLRTPEGPVHLRAGLATPQSFEVISLQPLLGRAFFEAEGEPGASSRVVVLSHEAWLRLGGGSADAVGSALDIDGAQWLVVGVLPPGRSLAPERPEPVDVWFPTGASSEVLGRDAFAGPGLNWFRTTVRLTEAAAAAPLVPELDRVAAALAADYPETHEGWRLNADPLRQRIFGSTDPVVALLLGAFLFWAIALLNLFGLFVQHGEDDARDTAVRVAVGASRGRIWRHRVMDAVIIGGAGAALAALVALAGFALLRASDPLQLPAHAAVGMGWLQLALITAGGVGGALAMAAVAGAVADSVATVHLPSARSATSPRRSRVAHAVLASQVTICTLLSIGAVSAARSLDELRSRDKGVASADVVSARMEVTPGLLEPDEIAQRARELVGRVRVLPDFADAFVWSPEIPSEARTYTAVRVGSPTEPLEGDAQVARYHTASPGAVTAFGLHVIAGRDIDAGDRDAGRRVALVSESAAVLWWGGADRALGERIQRTAHDEWSEVVGVVADAPMSGRFGPGSGNTLDVYFMFDQDPRRTILLFAVARNAAPDLAGLRATVATVVPELPLYDVRWMGDRLRDQERIHSSTAWLGGAYALASLLLATVGLAGASALLVQRRRVEIGVRRALGGTRGTVVLQLTSRGLRAGVAGLLVGAGLAYLALASMDPVILTIGPSDPVSYVSAIALLALCVTLALLIPTLSSVRRPPAECLADRLGPGGADLR